MRIINKKYLLIILLIGITLIGVIFLKPKANIQLDNVILKQEVNNKTFAMYIKNDDTYEEYKNNKFPEGYDLNLNKSKCIDNSGQEIENALYVQQGKIGVKSNKSFYCYLYFDLLEEKEFEYTGSYQVFITPKTGSYQIELWGASGGGAYYNYGNHLDNNAYEPIGEYIKGGNGAYTKGIISLEKNERLYIYVGEMGKDYFSVTNGQRPSGGYNGGGQGGSAYQVASGGGGATDIRLNISETGNWDDFNSLKSRIMVAGAGAGTSNFRKSVSGGYAGGLIGDPGHLNKDNASHTLATGGTQKSGGTAGNPSIVECSATNGKFGKGGDSQCGHGSGGGSGYYGGGGGSAVNAGVSTGAGGSSFISGYKGCVAIKQESTEDNIITNDGCTEESPDVTCSYHYSGKVFTEMEMIAGNAEMPTHDGQGKMVGNTGNGYAKIKLINVVS